MTRPNTARFSTKHKFIVTIVVVGVVICGALAVYIYSSSKSKRSSLESPTSHATGTPIKGSQTPAQQRYLHINEWNVSIPLGDEIDDLYYVPAKGAKIGNDGQLDLMWVGMTKLDGYGCSAKEYGTYGNTRGGKVLTSIIRSDIGEVDGITGQKVSERYPDGVSIGSYYYAFNLSIIRSNPCTDKFPVADLLPYLNQSIRGAISN